MRTLFALLLVAGCSAAPLADRPCEGQAEQDPEVRDLILKGAGSPSFLAENQDRLSRARQRATLDCLRGKGLIRPGGVEAQRPL